MLPSSKLSDRDRAILNSIFNPSLPLGEGVFDEETRDDDDSDDCETSEEIKALEIRSIKYAENKEYEEALNVVKQVLELSPGRAATLNNRAQIYRLMGNDKEAFDDLTKALELTEGKKGRTRRQALCQRGMLLLKFRRDDEARRDFDEAAKLGSSFAKQQMVQLNPYAALCNQMLSQVMNKLN